MANNQCEDGIQISPRCLGIVFRERKQKKAETVAENLKIGSSDCNTNLKLKHSCGEQLFHEFITENECCYWNPHLQESIKHLKFEGHFHPYTILVTGRDIYLDTVKSAWAHRIIRSPKGFIVHRVGEVCSISMVPIAQSQFTPLPEALCITISDLTKNNEDASFDAIMDQLKSTYKGLQQPTEQITYQTLASLIKERKIYHTGRGYHILSPDLYQPGSNNITVKEHHLVIGGTDTADGITPMLYIPLIQQGNNSDMRSISCQTETKATEASQTDATSKLDKSDLVTKKEEKSPTARNGKKNKKEAFVRSSSIRYGEEKCKNLVKDINLKTSDINQDKDKGEKSSLFSKLFGRNKSKDAGSLNEEDKPDMVEYATFSAQFPPQEWGWYQAQLERQVQVASGEHPVMIHSFDMSPDSSLCMPFGGQHNESSTEAVYHEIHNHSADCPVARTFPAPANVFPRSSSHSGSWSSLTDGPPAKATHPKSHHRQNRSDTRQPRPLEEVHHNSPDVRPKEVTLNGMYPLREHADVREQRNTFDNPKLLNNGLVTSPDRPSHVTKVFKKYREMKCTTLCANDISVEYCGRMPRKETQLARSRDSGVNCIGLASNSSPPQMFGSCHYNATEMPLNNHLQSVQESTPEKYTSHPISHMTNNLPQTYQHPNAENIPEIQADGLLNSSHSPGQLSSEDMYPLQEIRNEACRAGTATVSDRLDHNHRYRDSEVSLWSDNSRQTVREVRQLGRHPAEEKNHAGAWPLSKQRTQRREQHGLVASKDQYAENDQQSNHQHRHNRSRSKSPQKGTKDGDRGPKVKTDNRQTNTNGKTLANHVYESHQRIATRPLSGHKSTDLRYQQV